MGIWDKNNFTNGMLNSVNSNNGIFTNLANGASQTAGNIFGSGATQLAGQGLGDKLSSFWDSTKDYAQNQLGTDMFGATTKNLDGSVTTQGGNLGKGIGFGMDIWGSYKDQQRNDDIFNMNKNVANQQMAQSKSIFNTQMNDHAIKRQDQLVAQMTQAGMSLEEARVRAQEQYAKEKNTYNQAH